VPRSGSSSRRSVKGAAGGRAVAVTERSSRSGGRGCPRLPQP
jgi:hypothetical protein